MSAFDTWFPARALADPSRPELPALLDGFGRIWSSRPAVAAALFWKQYAWHLVGTALARWPDGVVPDLGLDETCVRVSRRAPFTRIRPSTLRRADPVFARWFVGEVVEGHLAPIVEQLHRRTRIGRRTLWGSVAHAIAVPLSERFPEPETTVTELLADLGGPVDGLVEVGGCEVVRRTCCLAFRSDEPAIRQTCGYCPVENPPLLAPRPRLSDDPSRPRPAGLSRSYEEKEEDADRRRVTVPAQRRDPALTR